MLDPETGDLRCPTFTYPLMDFGDTTERSNEYDPNNGQEFLYTQGTAFSASTPQHQLRVGLIEHYKRQGESEIEAAVTANNCLQKAKSDEEYMAEMLVMLNSQDKFNSKAR